MATVNRRGFVTSLPLGAWGLASCLHRSRGARHEAPRADRVEVRLGAPEGAFDRLSGVQGSPHPLIDGEPSYVSQYRAVGVERARIDQDCPPNTLTLGGIFPDEAADPSRAGSYRFEAVDAHVRAAREAGCDVLWQASYDVGRSDRWNGLNLGGRAPTDLERWCRVVERCLSHFVEGWADGLDDAVRWVEFINEPDGLGGFNGEHAPRLLPAFLRFLATVKGFNDRRSGRRLLAVGPGVPLSLAEWPRFRGAAERLCDTLRPLGDALPVFSFHTYGDDLSPASNARLAREIRALLDARGLRDVALWNTEWQGGEFLSRHLGVTRERASFATPAERHAFASGLAAYAIACKLRWQSVVTGSFYYRANHRAFPPGQALPFGELGPGHFFTRDGHVGALAMQEALLRDASRVAPERCLTAWNDDGLLACVGLRTHDGTRAALLATNLSTEERLVTARFTGASLNGDLSVRETALAAQTRALAVEARPGTRALGGVFEVTATLAPLSSKLIVAGA